MSSEEIRNRFLKFFEKRGHSIIPSASLVPENDPSVLFNTAGMQPLVPYLLGESHPMGKRLANVQKCVRTQDIDEVGDNTHDTFFEMLGNWSLGDYFKVDAIKWSYELLTSEEEGFGLDPKRLYVTVFKGDENAPRDDEAKKIWMDLGIPEHRIYFLGADSNWWPAVKNKDKDTWSGPTGPDTEMFYDVTEEGLGDLTHEEFLKADDEQKVIEIWNDVFMMYQKKDGKIIGELKSKNVDTGAGLERLAMVLQAKDNIFDTDLFDGVIREIKKYSKTVDEKAVRIVADHVRTAMFMITDGVLPSNKDRGYILRRLIRRASYYFKKLGAKDIALAMLAHAILPVYKNTEYGLDIELIDRVITDEETLFNSTLLFGEKQFEKLIQENNSISGKDAFNLFSTYGFPFELTEELANDIGVSVDKESFDEEFKKHQETSRAGSDKKFAGGLADHNEETVRLHTAHHLLLASLQKVLGPNVHQRGSNITGERLRIDFSFDRKMTPEEKQEVEDLVNKKISEGLPVVKREMTKEEAEKIGAEMEFGVKYGDRVNVYFVEEKDGTAFSKEFCGGPHVKNTGELGHFKITKEEASSAGVRRIKAVLN